MNYLILSLIALTAASCHPRSQNLSQRQPAGLSQDPLVHFSILHTNDLHSHFEGNGPDRAALQSENGHFARLIHLIHQLRTEKEKLGPVLLVDSGDFYSGSLFHMLGPDATVSVAPELDFLHFLNYDAVTLGNHEFDASEKGLANMLEKHHRTGANLPLISSNLVLDDPSPLTPFVKPQSPTTSIRSRIIKEFPLAHGVFRVGILGIMGPEAAYGSLKTRTTAHFIGYEDQSDQIQWKKFVSFVQEEVDTLREKEEVNAVVLLLHGGHPEDEKLAREVDGIDVLIAGHTHERYNKPSIINKTVINQTGSNGRYLGVLNFTYDGAKLNLLNPEQTATVAVNTSIAPDPGYLAQLEQYKKMIAQLLEPYGQYAYDSQVFTPRESLKVTPVLFNELGTFVTEGVAIRLNHEITHGKTTSLDKACTIPPGPESPVSFYLTALSLIRSDIEASGKEYQFSDIFRVLPVGYDRNLQLGFPVITYYLTQSEVYQLLSMFEYASRTLPDAVPAFSNSVSFKVGWGIPVFDIPLLHSLKELKIGGVPYKNCQALIKVASNLFILENVVTKARTKSHGFVNIVPKDWQGKPIQLVDQAYPREFILLADYLKNHY